VAREALRQQPGHLFEDADVIVGEGVRRLAVGRQRAPGVRDVDQAADLGRQVPPFVERILLVQIGPVLDLAAAPEPQQDRRRLLRLGVRPTRRLCEVDPAHRLVAVDGLDDADATGTEGHV
jgi:hypothetical protein